MKIFNKLNKLKKLKKYNLEIMVVFFCFFIDQISKILIIKNFKLYESLAVVKNIFHITFIKNTGIAFGIFQDKNIFITIISLFAIVAYLVFAKDEAQKMYAENCKNILFRFSLGMLIGGAIGNIFDRFFYGAVIDFLDFRFWPIFNLADSFICISITFFIFYFIFIKKQTKV